MFSWRMRRTLSPPTHSQRSAKTTIISSVLGRTSAPAATAPPTTAAGPPSG